MNIQGIRNEKDYREGDRNGKRKAEIGLKTTLTFRLKNVKKNPNWTTKKITLTLFKFHTSTKSKNFFSVLSN